MFRISLTTLTFLLAIGLSPPSDAATVTHVFNLTTGNGSIVGGEFESVVFEYDDMAGLEFDAQLFVDGSQSITQDANGLGITGGLHNAIIDDGEFATFTLVLSNILGGSVAFDGFQEVETIVDSGAKIYSIDQFAFTTADNFSPASGTNDISGTSPQTFSVIAESGTGNFFQPSGVGVQFTTSPTAVPEPGSLALLGIAGVGIAFRSRRRKTGSIEAPEVTA
ncbi:PEP-CTERM sorting domain-containing protein [Rhodopirellula sallentina]|uniref:Secreted protein containing PEP-CTERM bacterial domain protein n=1 Tax=Rhodopirellula sallentina SM41 TaxID=1263870 RepID=M5TSG9_9BACT|nr:PEP-CTERM sorting domain-containing protein [Rhodopirellula sallentina]EMI52137.1 secreted protein containing PEP-CTERM bacterial domain protein [Rhodopirellula sallentina SM41]